MPKSNEGPDFPFCALCQTKGRLWEEGSSKQTLTPPLDLRELEPGTQVNQSSLSTALINAGSNESLGVLVAAGGAKTSAPAHIPLRWEWERLRGWHKPRSMPACAPHPSYPHWYHDNGAKGQEKGSGICHIQRSSFISVKSGTSLPGGGREACWNSVIFHRGDIRLSDPPGICLGHYVFINQSMDARRRHAADSARAVLGPSAEPKCAHTKCNPSAQQWEIWYEKRNQKGLKRWDKIAAIEIAVSFG